MSRGKQGEDKDKDEDVRNGDSQQHVNSVVVLVLLLSSGAG